MLPLRPDRCPLLNQLVRGHGKSLAIDAVLLYRAKYGGFSVELLPFADQTSTRGTSKSGAAS